MSDSTTRRAQYNMEEPPSTPPLQPRRLDDWLLKTPGSNLTPVVNYAAAAVEQNPSRMFGTPRRHNQTPTQVKGRAPHTHVTPQPRAPWMSIESPGSTDGDARPAQIGAPDSCRSRTPQRAVEAQYSAACGTPQTPRRRTTPSTQMIEESPGAKAAKASGEAYWRMPMCWNEPWLPQPPPPFFPPSWGQMQNGQMPMSPMLMSPSSKSPWSTSPFGSPSPCRLPGGRSEETLEELVASQDPNEDRFVREFADATPLGKGQFATVFRATSRLDKQSYAVKVVRRSTAGGDKDRMNEVHVLASVAAATTSCTHILRYFSSWLEDGDLYIQTELCGGSLRVQLRERRGSSQCAAFPSQEIARVMTHVASGLSALHRLGFAHLDVKPDNILTGQALLDGKVCYKLGDLGLAAAVPTGSGPAPRGSVNEGDCRYLAMEVLRGGVLDVTKADIFALGVVSYEMATNIEDGPPANGEAWQQLRSGQIEAPALPEPLLAMMRGMLHPEAESRPSAEEALCSPLLSAAAEPEQDGMEALRAQLAAARAAAAAAEDKAQQLAVRLAAAGLGTC